MRERGARPLAGGQSLIAQLTRRELNVELLVDLGEIRELHELTTAEGTLELGAMVTVAALEDDPRVAAGWPLLTQAARHVGHRPIRNRATVGGSIAFADPVAEVPLALAVLGARIHRHGELISRVSVPPCHGDHGFHELSRRTGDRAVALAAAIRRADGTVQLGTATVSSGRTVVALDRSSDDEMATAGTRDTSSDYEALALRECIRRAIAQASQERTP
jgi:CO/xanthine dehydrogenase FAD-binding subunit